MFAGCVALPGPDCRDETRSLGVTALLTPTVPGTLARDTGRAHVSLYEARNARTKVTSAREILWFVGSSVSRSAVDAVHVHEEGTERLLYVIPLESIHAPEPVITRVFTRQPYAGPTQWNELYTLLGRERTYIDVHTSTGELRGVLRREDPNWQAFTHAYCS